jgi:hypothetical protein
MTCAELAAKLMETPEMTVVFGSDVNIKERYEVDDVCISHCAKGSASGEWIKVLPYMAEAERIAVLI